VGEPDTLARPAGQLLGIVGPTAAGKSGFALEVATRFGGEIVSCDSMAVYRRLDIGTDKPSPADRERIPHHLIDVAEPGSYYSAGAFRRTALRAMQDIWSRNRLCVLVGGTGLYYRALTQGLIAVPGRQDDLRQRLQARIRTYGPERLHRVLARFDPSTAARIGARDSLRIVRAMEVFITTGKPQSKWITETPFGKRVIPGLRLGLTAPRGFLYDRIERRVDEMMRRGLLEEVKALHREAVLTGPVRKAIGYLELAAFLEGLISLDEAVAQIKLHSRRLAKRQMTWFRKETDIKWFEIDKEAWKNDAMEFIKRWSEKAGR
jgi:tRNA dimethylallyltransferase